MSDKFDDTMYVTVYELARDGFSNRQIGFTLGITAPTFKNWCEKRPALRDAITRGRGVHKRINTTTFHEYVYDHLSPELKILWEKIVECEKLKNGIERIDALLKNEGKQTRQYLFIHALTKSGFNTSQALKMVGVPKVTFDKWRECDPDFAALIDEIHWHKKNFFEQAFIRRVIAGDTSAVIHAVKTQCRDRGYNEKVEVHHTGTVNHQHTIAITDLNLDSETLHKVLIALREQKPKAIPTDVEIEG